MAANTFSPAIEFPKNTPNKNRDLISDQAFQQCPSNSGGFLTVSGQCLRLFGQEGEEDTIQDLIRSILDPVEALHDNSAAGVPTSFDAAVPVLSTLFDQ